MVAPLLLPWLLIFMRWKDLTVESEWTRMKRHLLNEQIEHKPTEQWWLLVVTLPLAGWLSCSLYGIEDEGYARFVCSR